MSLPSHRPHAHSLGTRAAILLLLAASPAAAARAQHASATPLSAASATPPASVARVPGGGAFDASASLVLSTLGYGAEFNKLLNDRISLRVGGYFVNYNLTQTQEDVEYKGKIAFRNFSAMADFYLFRRGSFHLSGGVVGGSNEITGVGVPQAGGTYTINGTDYTSDQVSTVHAKAVFPSSRPYVGLGWGSPAKHGFHVTNDLGAVFGSPKYTLATTGAGAPQLQADIEADQRKTQKDADKYVKVFPVFRLGVTYGF